MQKTNSQTQISRFLYAEEGLRQIPKVIELVDRNCLSPTYGCFDRSYWHYRTSDFPSGMFAECVLPLALVYQHEFPDHRFYRCNRIKELVLAGIHFAQISSHRDGSCDDYYPFEKALGAAVFSLYAMTEACLVLGLREESHLEFFKRRACWVLRARESGRLSNHHALAALALQNVFLLTGEEFFRIGAKKKIADVLSWQHPEGWFPEYEGCDPGYLTFTIDFLAKYFQKTGEDTLLGPLRNAVEFASQFMHPDGSFGGEYGSRHTFHFLPHGFEWMGRYLPLATEVADGFLRGLANEKHERLDDDRIFCHSVYNLLQAYLDYCPERCEAMDARETEKTRYFEGAGLYIRRSGDRKIFISTRKGGVFKLFQGESLASSDTGLVGKTSTGERFVTQTVAPWQIRCSEKRIDLDGFAYRWKAYNFSPLSFLFFRAFLLILGRFLPGWVRRLAQKKMILQKRKLPIRFSRSFLFEEEWRVEDVLRLEDPQIQIRELYGAADSATLYVATSQPFQEGSIRDWKNLNGELLKLNRERSVRWVRSLG